MKTKSFVVSGIFFCIQLSKTIDFHSWPQSLGALGSVILMLRWLLQVLQKMEDDSSLRVAFLYQPSRVSCETTTSPHTLGKHCPKRTRSFLWPLSLTSGSGVNWVPKTPRGSHEYFFQQDRGVMRLCYTTGFGLRDLGRGSWSPAKSALRDTSSS